MQTFIMSVLSKPGRQRQRNEPAMFSHVPFVPRGVPPTFAVRTHADFHHERTLEAGQTETAERAGDVLARSVSADVVGNVALVNV